VPLKLAYCFSQFVCWHVPWQHLNGQEDFARLWSVWKGSKENKNSPGLLLSAEQNRHVEFTWHHTDLLFINDGAYMHVYLASFAKLAPAAVIIDWGPVQQVLISRVKHSWLHLVRGLIVPFKGRHNRWQKVAVEHHLLTVYYLEEWRALLAGNWSQRRHWIPSRKGHHYFFYVALRPRRRDDLLGTGTEWEGDRVIGYSLRSTAIVILHIWTLVNIL